MRSAFLVAIFSFLRISNLAPYTLSEVHSSTSFFLRRRDITFTASGAYLQIFKTKTIQFKQRILKISLPDIPNSILCSVTALTTYFTVFLAPHGSGFTPGGSLAFFFAQFQKRGCHLCLQLRSSLKGIGKAMLTT